MEAIVDHLVREIFWQAGLLSRQYSVLKHQLSEMMGIPDAQLHLHVGMLIFVASTILVRRNLRSALPLLTVVGFALLNEGADWMAGKDVWRFEPVSDIIHTTLWPAILHVVLRYGR